MAKIVTLKDNNDNIVYPITPVDGVFVDSNTTLADELNNKVDKGSTNIITVYKTSTSSNVGQATIAMDATSAVLGTKLTLDSSGVKIGSGVQKVLVSANVFYDLVSGKSYGWCDLRVNGTTTGFETIASITNSSYGSAVMSPVLLTVSAGDVITLYNKESGSKIRGGHTTYMTVQVVE